MTLYNKTQNMPVGWTHLWLDQTLHQEYWRSDYKLIKADIKINHIREEEELEYPYYEDAIESEEEQEDIQINNT